jgi:hypothetical protein
MRPIEEMLAINAAASGISVEENRRLAEQSQFIREINGDLVSGCRTSEAAEHVIGSGTSQSIDSPRAAAGCLALRSVH